MSTCEQSMIAILILSLGLCSCNQDVAHQQGLKDGDKNLVRISSIDEPPTLDPRFVRDLPPVTILHMLYEGLVRTGFSGEILPGIAEKWTVSDDHQTYTFSLRESHWSDGTPLTAGDFVETWLSILKPNFPAPNAYQLYPIKGAKKYKEKQGQQSSVGIKALDNKTLVVQLEQPTPYFLELLTTHFYYPVHEKQRHLALDEINKTNPIVNGPFTLESWKHSNELRVTKNVYYWDRKAVNLNGIVVTFVTDQTALHMFEAEELDWTGSPMSTIPQDAVLHFKSNGELRIVPAAGTHWVRFNIEGSPFNSAKMRLAFAYAIDRKAIVDHVLQGNQTPAYSLVPPSFGLNTSIDVAEEYTPARAWELFQAALKELNVDRENLPPITLRYLNSDRYNKIAQALQNEWSRLFGIKILLEHSESKVFYDALSKGDFQLSLGGWFADFHDPINFLEVFKSKSNPTNNTGWENKQYAELLNKSESESDSLQRRKLLQQAEELLLSQMPVAPIYHAAYNYLDNERFAGIYFSELGYLDFKETFLDVGDISILPPTD